MRDGDDATLVIQRVVPAAGTQQLLLERGDAHLVVLPSIGITQDPREMAAKPGVKMVETPSFRVTVISMNTQKGPLKDGWFTEQLADVITRRFLTPLDAYMDFHSGGAFPTVDYVYVFTDERLSRAFGSRFLYRPAQPLTGTAAGVVAARARPAMVVELGGGDVDQREYVERGVRGILNVMQALDMLPGTPAPPPVQVVLTEIATIRPRTGGLLVPEVTELGRELPAEAVLGRVCHPQTFEPLEVIRTPYRRNVSILVHKTVDVVEPGCYGYMIGNLDTAAS